MKSLPLSAIATPTLRQLAERIDQAASAGNLDGVISVAEVDQALVEAERAASGFENLDQLRGLRTFVEHFGTTGTGPVPPSSPDLFDTTPSPVHVGEGTRPDSVTRYFQTGWGQRNILEHQPILIPLDPGKVHLFEVRYQDTRKLRDLEFNYREPGSSAWTPFRGDQWFELERREQKGEIQIKREPDHNGPWINNPIRVKVEVLYPDGRIHDLGKKLVDPHVHDAHSVDGPGSGETDNIYKNLPQEKLPPGCLLRLTPFTENKKDWEQSREVALSFEWARPIRVPDHVERRQVHASYDYASPPSDGYPVDANRKIAAVLVNWTDNGGASQGSISVMGDGGRKQSGSYNVGSGETELIPVDDYARDGRIRVQGHGSSPVHVRSVEVLYAE